MNQISLSRLTQITRGMLMGASCCALATGAAAQSVPDTHDALPPESQSAPVEDPVDASPASDEAGSQPEIVVTGSRAATTGFAAPSPTTVVGSAAIEQRQVSNIATLLNEIPAFRATTSPAANAIRTQTPGANTADLRGLGAQRTLVLINGARVVPLVAANNNGSPVAVDLNQIPTLMIDRLEVVTGGASAQWGSDAVAGVVNIILKNRFEGFQIRAQTGISQQGDNASYRIGALGGFEFADGAGHIVGGFDYEKREGMGDIYTRNWGRQEYGQVANAGYLANGLAPNIITPGVRSVLAPGGLITGAAPIPGAASSPAFSLLNYTFLPGGTGVRPYDLGTVRNASNMIGGEGTSLARGVSLAPATERMDPYVHAEIDFGGVTAFLEGSYAISLGTSATLPPRDSAATIFSDNAFLPAVVRTALGTRPSFTINRVGYDLGNAQVRVKSRTPHILAGLKGDFGAGWSWDAHVGWGKNMYVNQVFGNRIVANYRFATDAVINPANGQIVCRATLPGATFNAAATGCVPINLFGDGSPSQTAIAYVTGTARSTSNYTQTTAAANLRGKPFDTWAGPVSIALGAEYRKEKQAVNADPIARAGGFEASNGSAFRGAFDVKEGYFEAIVPLAKDLPLLHSLDVNGAIRVADYSSAGRQTTWKVGGTWEPVDGLRFRATRSLDIRAPAIFELFSPGTVTNQGVTIGTITAANIPQNPVIGNPSLTPERAKTLTVGAVVQPRAVPGLSVSVDYYDINLKEAITSITGVAAGQLCARGDAYFCGLFSYNAVGIPTAYAGHFINAAAQRTSGLDIAGSYRLPFDRIESGATGSLTLAFSGTYTFHNYSDLGTGAARTDSAGSNNTPRFRSNTSLTYSNGGFDATLQVMTISGGKIDNTADLAPTTRLNVNKIPRYAYLNSQISYQINDNFKLFGSISNILDRDPPAIPSATLFTVTNGVFYDVVGRAFQIGADIKF